jgi:nucleoside-diphosphate-sugar epimerase
VRVLVTGATGFFGEGIVNRLKDEGHSVIGASRQVKENTGQQLDITDPIACRDMLASGGYDTVIHAAAIVHASPGLIDDAQVRTVNAKGVQHMAEAAVAAGVERFIFISSVMVYGEFDLPILVTEEHSRRAVEIYGLSKIEGEDVCLALSAEMDLTVLRMAAMYSPEWLFNVRRRVVPPVIGRYCYLTLDPKTHRYSLCSLRNGVEAVVWATEGRLPEKIYNVADSNAYRQVDILRAIEHVEGGKLRLPLPKVLPKAAWHLLRASKPSSSWGLRAQRQYWAFCEHNMYSTVKLQDHGLFLPQDLLTMGDSIDQ